MIIYQAASVFFGALLGVLWGLGFSLVVWGIPFGAMVILLALAGTIMFVCIIRAPEGYEDATGYHNGRPQ